MAELVLLDARGIFFCAQDWNDPNCMIKGSTNFKKFLTMYVTKTNEAQVYFVYFYWRNSMHSFFFINMVHNRTRMLYSTTGHSSPVAKLNSASKGYYTDIDRDGHEISRFGGLPRELYFPKGLYFPEVCSTEGKYCPEVKYNYLGTTDTWYFIRPSRYLLY